jgi:3-hydroxyisobutyrate dehydrogenase-like beta-hydroxyacid dehydrogenase
MGMTGQEPVAVLGIGAMGHGMATSALRAGIPTIVWNRTPAPTRDLAEQGADVAATAADAARRAAIVVTMVTDTDAVVSIARDQGMLAALAPGAIWVQTSTIGVAGTERVAAMVAAEGVANAAALAGRLGLATETVIQALAGSPLVSPWQAAKLHRIATGEFSAQFALSLALKDVRLALQAADDDRFTTFACLAEEWGQVADQGLGDQDLTVVTRWLEQHEGAP